MQRLKPVSVAIAVGLAVVIVTVVTFARTKPGTLTGRPFKVRRVTSVAVSVQRATSAPTDASAGFDELSRFLCLLTSVPASPQKAGEEEQAPVATSRAASFWFGWLHAMGRCAPSRQFAAACVPLRC
jgi:hypothetical protein